MLRITKPKKKNSVLVQGAESVAHCYLIQTLIDELAFTRVSGLPEAAGSRIQKLCE